MVLFQAVSNCVPLAQIDLSCNNLTDLGRDMTGVNAIADAISVSAVLTSIMLLGNYFDDETASMLLKIKEEKPSLISLCGLALNQTEANFSRMGLDPADAKLLAPEIAVRASLTQVLAFSRFLSAMTLCLCYRSVMLHAGQPH